MEKEGTNLLFFESLIWKKRDKQRPMDSVASKCSYTFQIPNQNSRASLVCLLPVLFLFLKYRRLLVHSK